MVEAWLGAAVAASAAKGNDPVVLVVGEVLTLCEWFLVVSGNTDRQVRAITEEVMRQVRLCGGPHPARVEGLDELSWVLLDYGDFVVHVFRTDQRELYDLERLWADVPRRSITAAPPNGPASQGGPSSADTIASHGWR